MYRTPNQPQHPTVNGDTGEIPANVTATGSVDQHARTRRHRTAQPNLQEQRPNGDATFQPTPFGGVSVPADPFYPTSVSQQFPLYNTTPHGFPAQLPDPYIAAQRYGYQGFNNPRPHIYTRQGQQASPPYYVPPGTVPFFPSNDPSVAFQQPFYTYQYPYPAQPIHVPLHHPAQPNISIPHVQNPYPVNHPAQPNNPHHHHQPAQPNNPPPPPPIPRHTRPVPPAPATTNVPQIPQPVAPIIHIDPSLLRLDSSPSFSTASAGHITKLAGRKKLDCVASPDGPTASSILGLESCVRRANAR
ncbi:hypothetical protein BDZ89DRAFT_1146645 [Hymenopellis radicata]|nr:hypothetical protein BDZ89DRAFT_1146645 [Hymenopellis radicata]